MSVRCCSYQLVKQLLVFNQKFLLLYLKRLKSILKQRMLLKLTHWFAGKLQTSCRCYLLCLV